MEEGGGATDKVKGGEEDPGEGGAVGTVQDGEEGPKEGSLPCMLRVLFCGEVNLLCSLINVVF